MSAQMDRQVHGAATTLQARFRQIIVEERARQVRVAATRMQARFRQLQARQIALDLREMRAANAALQVLGIGADPQQGLFRNFTSRSEMHLKRGRAG